MKHLIFVLTMVLSLGAMATESITINKGEAMYAYLIKGDGEASCVSINNNPEDNGKVVSVLIGNSNKSPGSTLIMQANYNGTMMHHCNKTGYVIIQNSIHSKAPVTIDFLNGATRFSKIAPDGTDSQPQEADS